MSRSLAPALVTADDIMEFDLDGDAVDARGRSVFLERFIHAEIYKARPDVMSVVHTHSPGVIPFTVSQVPLRAIYHNPAFLAAGAPVWDIRKDFGETDMLVRDSARGKSLAQTLGDKAVVLMRGHGDVTVGPSVRVAVFRAYYTDVNARLQSQAMALGGELNYLTPGEGAKADAVNLAVLDRAAEPPDFSDRIHSTFSSCPHGAGMKTIRAFLADETGATAIEYGLIAAGISLAIIAVINGLGAKLNTKFTAINTSLK
jgi:HCOMODA/2-hydroxy-3-carboxy-muconic semialdehyde decarboxylase